MTKQSLRIAVAQTTATADVRSNGETVRRLMREAGAEQARLVQFPEGFLSGYAKEQIQDWGHVDWPAVRGELEQIIALAAELRIWVVLGSAHPLTPPHRPHNSLYVISDQGTIVDRYDKRFCSHTEITTFYSPGFEPVVFDVDGYRFGCAICVEINFPDLFTQYGELGVDCLLLSAYPVDEVFEAKARAYASINTYWTGMALPSQTSHLMNSGVIGPDGRYVAQLDGGEGLVYADLERSAYSVWFDKARPWRRTALLGDIYRSRRVDDPRSEDRTCF
ncbi:carbon-nitrogen hydrolase family protein [Kribbella pratensis]|uniref:Amidohydrolase n=1 Tax=Kribbella pratensis TaxID=2512112 RepID=A0A4R8C339_9ACTN|nr:carbon-nitrogen hydrolase family protein [Kribbella pratensis]TDW70209.1 putative amidohydrolase [Kribbella pratensis]